MKNKKIIALVMATMVGAASVPVISYHETIVAKAAVGDLTVKEVSIDGFASANTGNEKMIGDFELEYTFVNETKDSTLNHTNYVVEVFNGENYITTRADRYGWYAGSWNDGTNPIEWEGEIPDWEEFKQVMKSASVKVTVKRSGQHITITNYIISNDDKNPKSYTLTAKALMKNTAEEVYVHLTGEKVNLYDITARLKDSSSEPAATPEVTSGSAVTSVPAITSEPAIATTEPTTRPTEKPTETPTKQPEVKPTEIPATEPTVAPSEMPETKPNKKPSLKTSKIIIKNKGKALNSVSIKTKKSVKLTVSVNSKAKIKLAKLSKKDGKIAKVTFNGNRLFIKGIKKGKLAVKLTTNKTASYKAASKIIKVTVK